MDPRPQAGQPVQFTAEQFAQLMAAVRHPPPAPRLMTISAAARLLGIANKTLHLALRRYNVPFVVLSPGSMRLDRRDVDRMVEAMKARGNAALLFLNDRRRKNLSIDGPPTP